MKHKNKLTHFAWLCLLPLVIVACTDWDDHYDVDNQKVLADKTLWEEIVSRPQLEEYKNLLEQYGYKDVLNGTQMYTVFAPVGAIDTVGLSTEKIRTEVIENHIARFVHSANSATNDKDVIMLNTKSVLFTQLGDGYTFGENKLASEYNIVAKNGVLHVIEGQQKYFHNVWEYLTTDVRFDSIRNYLYSFNEDYLDEEKSVKGEINAEGKQEYLDSVIVSYNQMLYSLGQLNNEDSTYTMIVPTNDAWKEAYERIKPYYLYPRKGVLKPDSLQEYYTRLAMVRDLVFSHTVQKSVMDSLISTTRGVFYNPFETILSEYSGWEQAEECSNGGIFVVNELKHKPWDSWHKEIKIEAENLNALIEDEEAPRIIYRNKLGSSDTLFTKVSGGSYLEMQETRSEHPEMSFNVWNTLAGKYQLRIVFLPQKLATSKNKTIKPNLFKVECCFVTEDGKFIDDSPSFKAYELKNNPELIDTLDVGILNLERCVYGQEKVGVKVKIRNTFGTKTSDYTKNSGTFLIDCIILDPVKE